ncbi:MAG: hypothetical protein JSW13_05250 [Candidatus Aerophobus sp.]|nr:MAG: hypothetical protein JSW13_05250 [Candidatus Aerophobus sp.]
MDKKGVSYCRRYIDKVGIVNDLTFKAQPVTIMRITNRGSRIFLANGDILEEEKKSFEHHFPIESGNLYEQLMEVCSWLHLEPTRPVSYRNYLQNSDR